MRYVLVGIGICLIVFIAINRCDSDNECAREMFRMSFELDNIGDHLETTRDIPQTVALIRYHADRLRSNPPPE